jgi:hypothetical protein
VPWITSLATYLIDHLTSSIAAISKRIDSAFAKPGLQKQQTLAESRHYGQSTTTPAQRHRRYLL